MEKKFIVGLLSLTILSSAACMPGFAENDDAETVETTKKNGGGENKSNR